jgi:transcriptional regulator with XRE-family HTH domain
MRNQREKHQEKAAMTTKFDELMLDPEFRKLYAIEGLIADTAQLISDLLERRNLKRADLARLLNKTPAFVSQLLNGKANMTVRTLAEVLYALGASAKINALDQGESAPETTDCLDTHTFRIHVPVHGHGPSFSWGRSGTDAIQSRESETRSEYAA